MADTFQSPPKPHRMLAPLILNNEASSQEVDCIQNVNRDTPQKTAKGPTSGKIAVGLTHPSLSDCTGSERTTVSHCCTTPSEEKMNATINDVEKKLVDNAISDLPSVFSEVFCMQKGQSDEIKRQQERLHKLQDEFRTAEKQNTQLDEEIVSLTNRLYMIQEQICKSDKSIKAYEKELRDLTIKLYEEQRGFDEKQQEFEAETKKFNMLQKKAKNHVEKVTRFEKECSPAEQELQTLLKVIEDLKAQKHKLSQTKQQTQQVMSGQAKLELQWEISNLQEQINMAKTTEETQQEKISDEKLKQSQLQQTIQVLHKRNAAHLTRLKHHAKDLHQRNRQWGTQVTQLELKIAEARQQHSN